jgi:hypothetical protein
VKLLPLSLLPPTPTTPTRHTRPHQVEAALRTALCLRGYEDVLAPADIWALLGLTAFYAGFYGQCSKVGRERAEQCCTSPCSKVCFVCRGKGHGVCQGKWGEYCTAGSARWGWRTVVRKVGVLHSPWQQQATPSLAHHPCCPSTSTFAPQPCAPAP